MPALFDKTVKREKREEEETKRGTLSVLHPDPWGFTCSASFRALDIVMFSSDVFSISVFVIHPPVSEPARSPSTYKRLIHVKSRNV